MTPPSNISAVFGVEAGIGNDKDGGRDIPDSMLDSLGLKRERVVGTGS